MTTRRHAGRALIALMIAVSSLAACAPESVSPTPEPTAPVPSGSAAPAPEATFVPDGTAADNLPVFSRVVADVWGSDQRDQGRAYVDALVAVGFDKTAMQVTADRSTVGNAAESILFSVRWGEDCLIGQVGPETGEPVTSIDAAIDGVCLIGNTRPIDW